MTTYPEAAHAIKEMIELINWRDLDEYAVDLPVPSVELLAFDYLALDGGDVGLRPEPEKRESDWITVARMGGESTNTMDGWTGISRQMVRVGLFSLDRTRVSVMERAVHDKINNYTGVQSGVEFQCLLLDEVFDNNEEESTTSGKDMFFLTVVSPAG